MSRFEEYLEAVRSIVESEEVTVSKISGLLRKNKISSAEYKTTPGKFKIVSKSGAKTYKDVDGEIIIDILISAVDKDFNLEETIGKIKSILDSENISYTLEKSKFRDVGK